FGPNPQIQVSTTSGTYRPQIYIVQDGYPGGACPAGTGKTVYADLLRSVSANGTATFDSGPMHYLPLNVPLHLFVDSTRNDATSAAFFLSPEFQYTGYFVYRFYKGSLIQNGAGRFPTYQEFERDVSHVSSGIIQNNQLSASTIEANKKKFAEEFTQRTEFRNLY